MRYVVGILLSLAVLWVGLLVALYFLRPRHLGLRDVARIMPDTVRLIRRLARDPSLPRSIHVRLWLLLAFMVSPIDLIPDVIPVIGFADDIVLVYLVMRSVIRTSGEDAVAHHWPGTPDTLALVLKLFNG